MKLYTTTTTPDVRDVVTRDGVEVTELSNVYTVNAVVNSVIRYGVTGTNEDNAIPTVRDIVT